MHCRYKTGDTSKAIENRDGSANQNHLIVSHQFDITNSMPTQSSIIFAYIQGGFTDLLLGVQQDALMSSSARKIFR